MTEPWPFDEDEHLGVFVSVPMWEGKEPLLIVDHHDDGDWTFTGPTDVTSDDEDISGLQLVCLHHVVDRFPEIAALADMPCDAWAERTHAGALFVIHTDED